MKKLISFFLILTLLFAAIACAARTQTVSHRGELNVVFDNTLTRDLLAYFQANQDCIVTGTLLDDETDYAAISSKSGTALVKDEAVIQKLKDAGWTETENWTEKQKSTNESMFNFTVLQSPTVTESSTRASKLLTDWLVGDGTYDHTYSVVSGGCGCSRKQVTVTTASDAPDLAKNDRFKALVNP